MRAYKSCDYPAFNWRASVPPSLRPPRSIDRRGAAAGEGRVDNVHACIEKMVKKFKAHRNAKDFAKAFIQSS